MRHLGSLLAGLLAAPAVWLLIAIGQPRTGSTIAGWADRNTFDTAELIGPIAYLVGAGLVLGLVACLRLSPLGPLLAGLGYTALYVALFIDPLRVLDAIPDPLDVGPVEAHPRVPVSNGTLAVLAGCLLVAVFSVKRWRRWPVAADAAPAEAVPADASAGGTIPLVTPSPEPASTFTLFAGPDEPAAPGEPTAPPPPWPPPPDESITTEPATTAEPDASPAAVGGRPAPPDPAAVTDGDPLEPETQRFTDPNGTPPTSPWAGPPGAPGRQPREGTTGRSPTSTPGHTR